ncbi:MAG: hypothetical protein IT464_02370 [Planctomycetes bacterium]|nr:hypothetical protein [Planctomycetota bacterium]
MNKTATRILLPAVGALLVTGCVATSDTKRITRTELGPQGVVFTSEKQAPLQFQPVAVAADNEFAPRFGSDSRHDLKEVSRAPLIVFGFFADGAEIDARRREQIESYRDDLLGLRRSLSTSDFLERSRQELVIDSCVDMLNKGLAAGRVDAMSLDTWIRDLNPLTTASTKSSHTQTQRLKRAGDEGEIVRLG